MQGNPSGNFGNTVKDRTKDMRSRFLFNFPLKVGMTMLSC